MCGVSSITMSVWVMLLSLFENSCFRIGTWTAPGNPVSALALVLAQQARQQVRFAVAQAQPRA